MELSSPWTEVGSSDETHLKFRMPAYGAPEGEQV
jgi:hypothetical protein